MEDIAILLVDGQDAGLAGLASLLNRHGYRTRRVSSESDAISALQEREPSLVFIDLRHPQATHVCQRLRNTAVGAVTPVIMMGAPGTAVTCVADALAIGADFYFDGPWRAEAVLAKVRTYVGEGDTSAAHARPASRPETQRNATIEHAGAPAANQDEDAPDAAATKSSAAEPEIVHASKSGAPIAAQNTPRAAASPAASPTGAASGGASAASLPIPPASPPLGSEPTTDLTALVQPPSLLPPPRPKQTSRQPRKPATLITADIPCTPGSWDEAPPSGSLGNGCHVAQVLAQAWVAQASGRMDWQQGDVRVCLWLYEGSPCGYSSNLAHDHLAEFLSRTGSIRLAACRQLHLQNLPNPRLTLAYLVRLGELSAQRVWPLLTAHLAEQSYGLFAWESGEFDWHPDVMPLDERISLGVPTPGWLLEGLRRKYDMQRLVPQLGGPASLVVTAGIWHGMAPGLQLGEQETRMVRLLDGAHTLEDIAGTCQARLEEVYRLALLLVMLKHANIATRAASTAGSMVGVDPVRDAQRITEKLQQARLCDYFEILGVHAGAGSREVECAASQLQDAFHPSSFDHDLRMQYAAELAEIADTLADAKEVLADPGKRQAYAEQVG